MSDNRPPRYLEDDRIIYRASSLGMCDKIFVALAQGYSAMAHPAWFQEVLDEGTEAESVIRGIWEQDNQPVLDVGRVLEMEILDGVWLRGSIDGWVARKDAPAIWDAKKIRDSGWQRYLRVGVEMYPNYPFQFSAYMHMWEDMFDVAPDFIMAGGHYEQDEEGEWTISEVVTHEYTDPMVNKRALQKRIIGLERLIRETKAVGDLSCNPVMYPCPFYYLHDDDMEETPVRPGSEIIEANLKEWDELDTIVKAGKEAEKRAKTIKDGVKAWLVAAGQESGDVCEVDLDDRTVALKYLESDRKGYVVPDGTTTTVTIRVTKRDGEVVAKTPKKSRKAAPGTTQADGTGGAPGKKLSFTPPDPEGAPLDTPPDTPAPARRKLAPKP